MTVALKKMIVTWILANYFIDLSVEAFQLGIGVETHFNQPRCNVKFVTGEVRECLQFVELQECCARTDSSELEASQEDMTVLQTPAPASIDLNESTRLTTLKVSSQIRDNKMILMLKRKEANSQKSTRCWYLHVVNEIHDHEEESAFVVLSGLVDDLTAWDRTVFNVTRCFKDHEDDCRHFRKTTHTFEILSKQQEMRFVLMASKELRSPSNVTVQLWSGPCRFSCYNSSLQNCNLSYESHEMDINDAWRVPILVGFHCLRVSLLPDRECVIYTETKEMEAYIETPEEPAGFFLPSWLVTFLVVAVCAVFVVVIVVFVCVLKYHRRSRANYAQPGAVQNLPLLKQTPQIFLLYSRDSTHFCAAVESFKRVLEKHITKVFDPFDDAQQDEILRNKEAWLASLLEEPNIKIVFILSDGAIFRQKALLAMKPVVSLDPHCLDSIFINALNHIQHNMTLMNDYRRIFSVRFEDTVLADMSPSLTPLSRFTMPRDWHQLLNAIRGNHQMWIKDDEETSLEFENFKSKILDMKRLQEGNTHSLHSFVEETIS